MSDYLLTIWLFILLIIPTNVSYTSIFIDNINRDQLAPHIPMMLPAMDRLLPYLGVFMTNLDTFLPYSKKLSLYLHIYISIYIYICTLIFNQTYSG